MVFGWIKEGIRDRLIRKLSSHTDIVPE